MKKHFEVYGRYLPDWQLRQEIIPMLETSGLIYQEKSPNDKREIIIYPTTPLTISSSLKTPQNNSESHGGVLTEVTQSLSISSFVEEFKKWDTARLEVEKTKGEKWFADNPDVSIEVVEEKNSKLMAIEDELTKRAAETFIKGAE